VELWLVRDVPTWLVGLLIIAGIPAMILGLDRLAHRRLSHRRLGPHNEVTGVIFAMVGVAYAIVIGLCVVSLWEGYTGAKDNSREEAANLAALVSASAVFGPQIQQQITDSVIQFESDVVTDWQRRRSEGPERRRTADLDQLTAAIGALQPTTEAQKAFVLDAIQRIGEAEVHHHAADIEADDERMSGVMWFGVLISTVAVLVMLLLFGLDDGLVRPLLLILASAVVATNLFLIVQMNYPYYGSFAVSPEAFQEVVTDLRAGR